MSFIENTISFSAVEWGIKDPVDKLICNKFKSYPWDDEWFHKFHNAVSNRGRSCMYPFQFISETEYLQSVLVRPLKVHRLSS